MTSDTLRRALHRVVVKQKQFDDSIRNINDKLDKIENIINKLEEHYGSTRMGETSPKATKEKGV